MERFPEISENGLNDLVESRLSKRSKGSVKWSVKVFSDYAIARKQTMAKVEQFGKEELDVFLSKFYAAVRAKSGSTYNKNALGILYGLQKHFEK